MRILFVGDDWLGSNARSLANGLRQAGHDVVVVDTTGVTLPRRLSLGWTYSKVRGHRPPWVVERVHRQIEHAAIRLRPEMLFCFNAFHLDQARLLATPARLRVHYSPDDVSNPVNLTADYLAHEPDWDCVVTTKRHNVSELDARGAARVKFVRSAYDPAWHHPAARRSTAQYSVGFIGVARPDRADTIVSLARTFGARMAVWGPNWRRNSCLRASSAAVRGAVYGENFSVAVSHVAANLVLLNSDNRDTHTCRSFEVPAAGGLFVGERTDEHREMLAEGSQCLLFSSFDELVDIVSWVEQNPVRAADIAERGYRRITAGHHRYVDRAIEIVDALTATGTAS
ncbi:glycosyltransferase family 1 protein [Mycobacterium sp. PS03-16]|uniref:CgeB family protein n=1 Tax=Mycobacterium sp. PS03-16 TaxID=2559611 RepID=UPI001073C37E|nr:glycosyltransferase [Mycobacterium sp. PS03-16]TFV58653.1 glycosyltransferase family 1 protein [Mycobacterium sp. PS03-16]